MSVYSEEVLISKLNKLADTQDSISLLSHWLIYHRRHVHTSVDIWNRELRKASAKRKLLFIYLCNDVCQNSRRKGPEFIEAFRNVVPEAIEHAFRRATSDMQTRIRRVINVWEERQVFEKELIYEIKGRLSSQRQAQIPDNALSRHTNTSPSSAAVSENDNFHESVNILYSDLPPNYTVMLRTAQMVTKSRENISSNETDLLKKWSDAVAEEKAESDVFSRQIDDLFALLQSQRDSVTKNISGRRELIGLLNGLVKDEEAKLEQDEKSLIKWQDNIEQLKEWQERLRGGTIVTQSITGNDESYKTGISDDSRYDYEESRV
ncbi:4177_t:CDS:2 [Paraglomus brasilianum]|uniref:4177_t:CDS:1 n=1 Tax=Paraglomus brasilianum TaxID=144538 RepID=A0A9N9FRX1_9GLOM|nr:4177_t:CDS:2 [Paraglomus brasilianum]